jgi:hypothetical protein
METKGADRVNESPSPDGEEIEGGALDGSWRVERVSGWLLPFGLHKEVAEGRGSTRLGPLPVSFFDVRGRTLRYRGLPVRDELAPMPDGTWLGRGFVFGREFCRFRLVRRRTVA